jgi:hypothetical protein
LAKVPLRRAAVYDETPLQHIFQLDGHSDGIKVA